MESMGYRAEPSPARPVPSTLPYYSGGFSVFRYGSISGGWMDGVQIEVSYDLLAGGIRPRLVRDLAAALVTFLDAHYGFRLRAGQGEICPAFVDVPFSHPASQPIEQFARAGVISGCGASPRRFCPEASITRAEAAVFVERAVRGAAAQPVSPATVPFSDVPADRWEAAWVVQAWAHGYIAGCGVDPIRFCPDAPLSRGEAARLLARLGSASAQATSAVQLGLVDVPPDRAADVEAVVRGGWMSLCQGGADRRFCPDEQVTRADLVRSVGLATLGPASFPASP
jgi:hypothetical protein